MNVLGYLNISKYINNCPNCDSENLGSGHGSMRVENTRVERKCKCGFYFKYDVSEGVKEKQIKQAIDYALSEIE